MSDQTKETKYGECPHCGFVPSPLPMYYVDGDLLNCGKCKGRIDVIKKEGKLVFVKSTDFIYGVWV